VMKRKMMVASMRSLGALALLVTVACGDPASDDGVVARVGPYEMTVDEAVGLLVDQERLAADAGVVESLANLWIDYTLLAEAVARDSTLSDLGLRPMVLRQLQQRMVFQLRDSVIQIDTFITDEELRARYEDEERAVELRARHIMLRLPAGGSQAARDSVAAELGRIRARIEAGADFATLARELSQDPGTAGMGGDLGYFRRGEMVAPFEAATLALEPGELSDIVQTPMGLHLILLEDRRVRGFEQAAPEFRRQIQIRMVQEAESVFVAGLVERASPEVAEGATEIVRDLAARPGSGLTGRAARRPLVAWEGGEITVGGVREILQLESPALRSQIADGDDDEVQDFLQSLARRDLLIREAEAAGLRPPADSIAALVEDARTQLRTAARRLGLLDLDRAPGEELEIAVQRAVKGALADNVSGATQVVPLGPVAFQLREGRSSAILDTGVGEVIVEIAQIRAERQLSPVEESIVRPDTVGR